MGSDDEEFEFEIQVAQQPAAKKPKNTDGIEAGEEGSEAEQRKKLEDEIKNLKAELEKAKLELKGRKVLQKGPALYAMYRNMHYFGEGTGVTHNPDVHYNKESANYLGT